MTITSLPSQPLLNSQTTGGAGGTYRGPLSDLFNMNQINREDFERQKELSTHNAKLTQELRQTSYQDTISDLKKAGLNPLLAVGNGATSAPAVSSAAHSGSQTDSAQFLQLLGQIASGLIRSNAIISSAAIKSKK